VLLGSRLRNALDTGTLDRDLLASLEWSLDRHQSRAIALIRQGVVNAHPEDENVAEQLRMMLHRWEEDDDLHTRLTAILTALDLLVPVEADRPTVTH
jgi:hypothetical protein